MTRSTLIPTLCGLLLAAVGPAAAGEPSAPGVVRITKPAATTIRGQSDGIQLAGGDHGKFAGAMSGCPSGDCEIVYGDCEECQGKVWKKGFFGHGGHGHGDAVICGPDGCFYEGGSHKHTFGGHGSDHHPMLEYFKCKFGYFIPTGCGGAGCPPVGKYARVYPQDPSYFDQRDGQVWGAQGYGTPIAVPLAPVVGHQYNYSWGTPASRLTPISRIAPY